MYVSSVKLLKSEYRPNHKCITCPHCTSWMPIYTTANTVKVVQVCAVLVDLILHPQICMCACTHLTLFSPACWIPQWFFYWDLSQVSRKRVWGLLWRTLCTRTSKWVWHTEPILITSKFLRKGYNQIFVIWDNEGLGHCFHSCETWCVTALRRTTMWVASSSRFSALQEG